MAPIGRFRLFWRFTGWIAMILFLPAIVVTAISMFESRTAARLESAGATTEAVITGKEITVSTDSDGDKTTTFYLDYSFTHERRQISARDSVDRAFYYALEVGDRTPLRYWLEDPSVNEIQPGSSGTNALVTKVLAVIFWVLAGVWAERCWRKAARSVKVRDRGERRTATVIEHVRTNMRINNRPVYLLRWRDGAGAEGRSMWLRAAALAQYPVGTELTVYADPDGRLPAVWEGDVGPARPRR